MTAHNASAIPVSGLFEAHLTAADLARSVAFYRDRLGLPVALEIPERGAAFHWIGGPGHTMLGLWSIGSAPMGMKLHLAFTTALEDLMAAPGRLRAAGIEPLSFFGQPTDEPTVIGWMPAATLYFRDPDGHLLEYLTMLDEPAREIEGSRAPPARRAEAGIVPWSEWRAA